MKITYRMFFQYWGRGLLVAAVISAIGGLLLGQQEFVIHLYQASLILLVLAVIFLIAGKKMPETEGR